MFIRGAQLSIHILLLAALVVAICTGGCGDASSTLSDDDGPPYQPEEALSTFEIAEGFRIELIAAEPMIADPVAMEVDEAGRIYVIEMHGYPLDTGGSGKVKLLTDTDDDGRPDHSTTFAEGLTLPTGIMRWKEGVLVTDAPDVLYLEDSNGDGRADVKRVVLTGFGLSNPQHNLNTPVYGLDNWIHLANEGTVTTTQFADKFGDEGESIRFPGQSEAPTLPQNAAGRRVRFRPDTYELETMSSSTQFGHTFDAWGHPLLVSNSNHIYQEVVAARYLERNPDLLVASATESLSDHGQPAEVFPITKNPEHQLLTSVGVFTSASGLTSYLGDAFPPAYRGATFVAEPVHNLVHADRLSAAGATFTARRMQEGKEFMASTDSWFRPVNFYVGPDGALYVIDYYRQIIEHPEWMSEEVIQSGDLYNGTDRGRIYRIVPEEASPMSWMDNLQLGEASSEELVASLEKPNIWWRRTAQRLLVDRQSEAAVAPSLVRLVRESPMAEARVHALWTLEGLGALSVDLIEEALGDKAPGVRENAIQLAEMHLQEAPSLQDKLITMKEDPDQKVRFQLLLTLGYLRTDEARDVRQALLFKHINDEWMQIAALSASDVEPLELFMMATSKLDDRETNGRRAFFRRVGSLVGARQYPDDVRRVITMATDSSLSRSVWWRAASLEGLAGGLQGGELDALSEEHDLLLQTFFESDAAPMRDAALELLEVMGFSPGPARESAMERAGRMAKDSGADPARRADALRLLALGDLSEREELLRHLINPQVPAPVQKVAVRLLGRTGEGAGAILLAKWNALTPTVRDEAVSVFLAEPARIRLLLDAIESGKVQPSTIGRGNSVRLMTNRNEELRARARTLLAGQEGAREEVVESYQKALALEGRAEEGKQVFARVCAQCHRAGEVGGVAFGPDLSTVKNRSAEALMTDILIPNKSIADGYELWQVERTGGDALQGVIVAETSTSITLKNVAGQERTIPRTEIQAMSASGASAMPVGLEHQIDEQEMADLLTFLRQ